MTDSLSIIRRPIDDNSTKPIGQSGDVYQSLSGDSWQLIQGLSPAPYLVRHTSSPSAGGVVSDMSIEEFLAINGSGPEHDALRLLIGEIQTEK